MRLSKKQNAVVEELMNGGSIWAAGEHYYLATVDKDGRVKSTPVHKKTFDAIESLLEKNHEGRWVLK